MRCSLSDATAGSSAVGVTFSAISFNFVKLYSGATPCKTPVKLSNPV
jgi:hypothetical protein